MANDWLELRQHAETGIETIKAHFEGHAFDPHWHDSYLVGITLSGTQQFHCRRERHRSQPGDAFLLEPGEIHDGDAPIEGGFTYLTFDLDEHWLTRTLQGLYDSTPGSYTLHFAQTLTREPQLVRAIGDTFASLHNDEMKIVQQSTMDNLLSQITANGGRNSRLSYKAPPWRIVPATISMRISARTWGCQTLPVRRVQIALRSPAVLSANFTWHRTPGLSSCAWQRPDRCWRVGNCLLMLRR